MTEDEAKAKWCPFARTKTAAFGQDNVSPAGVNRDFDGEPVDLLHTCLASRCAVWRKRAAPREVMQNYHGKEAVKASFVAGGRKYEGGWAYSYTDEDHDGSRFDVLTRSPAADAPAHGECGLIQRGRP